jgi:hypothetical protein
MDEMLPAWMGKSKRVVVEAPSAWMSDRVMYFRSEKTRTWPGFSNIRDCRRREVEFETKR